MAGVNEEREEREADLRSAKALWDDLARKARGVHCPEHLAGPWRVVVLGETREAMRLQIYGCCDRLGRAINEMIAADPRISGPR